MTENTFPVHNAETLVNFYRSDVLTGQEAKLFTKSDLTPVPKVSPVRAEVQYQSGLEFTEGNLFS